MGLMCSLRRIMRGQTERQSQILKGQWFPRFPEEPEALPSHYSLRSRRVNLRILCRTDREGGNSSDEGVLPRAPVSVFRATRSDFLGNFQESHTSSLSHSAIGCVLSV